MYREWALNLPTLKGAGAAVTQIFVMTLCYRDIDAQSSEVSLKNIVKNHGDVKPLVFHWHYMLTSNFNI